MTAILLGGLFGASALFWVVIAEVRTQRAVSSASRESARWLAGRGARAAVVAGVFRVKGACSHRPPSFGDHVVIVLTPENLLFEYMAPWMRGERKYVLERGERVGILEDGTVYDTQRRFAFDGVGSGDMVRLLRSEGWVDPDLDSCDP